MKYIQINLENYGGFDIEFTLRNSEFQARVNDDANLLHTCPQKFIKQLNRTLEFVQLNIKYFSSTDQCTGPTWEFFREALVDSICKTYVMTYKEQDLVFS